MMARTLALVSAILVLAGGSTPGGDKKDDKDKLQGKWAVVSVEISGKKTEPEKKFLVIKGSDWTAPSGPTFTFKIDATKKPKELDLLGKKATWRGIYKIEWDTLTFCRSGGPKGERPTEFKGGEGVVLFVFKRAEK